MIDNEKTFLLKLARNAIEDEIFGEKRDYSPISENVLEKRGVFVTLTKGRKLRGCIGSLEPISTIFQAVIDNAKAAAFEDYRFGPVRKEELSEIRIEISVLSQLEELRPSSPENLLGTLRPGVHGLLIRKGNAGATFLPQVWDELPNPEDFLSNLCIKAGLPPDDWKGRKVRFFTYTVEKIAEY